MYVVLWEYEVKAGAEAAFTALYGNDGAWVALFGEHDGHLGTELLSGDDGRYLTIDRWTSAAAYDAFRAAARARYAGIDALGDALTVSERRVGAFKPC